MDSAAGSPDVLRPGHYLGGSGVPVAECKLCIHGISMIDICLQRNIMQVCLAPPELADRLLIG